MLLSEYDRVVCLCVDHRFKRERGRIATMLADQGVSGDDIHFFVDGEGSLFHPDFYDQITPTPPDHWAQSRGAYAHFSAMQKVVQQAKTDNIQNLLWIEDDCVFTKDFSSVVASATNQMRQESIPPWDLLYYGANHTWATTYELGLNVLRCYGSLTTHCVGIPAHTFDRMISLPPIHVIDKVMADCLHHVLACYAIWPAVAIQKPGYSHISGMETDYDHYFKSKGANHP